VTTWCWLWLASLGSFGVLVLVAPLATALVVFLGRSLLGTRLSRGFLLASLALSAINVGRAERALTRFDADRQTLRELFSATPRCEAEGVVVKSPVLRGERLLVTVDVRALACDERRLEGQFRLRLALEPEPLARGDRVRFVADLGPVAASANFELLDTRFMLAERGPVGSGHALLFERVASSWGLASLIDRARAHARARIISTFSPAAAPLARALVLGENDLDPEDQQAFQKSGLSHLLAVSGTHLVFAVVSLMRGLRACLIRIPRLAQRFDLERLVAPLGALLAILYADFAGGSGSAWRAAFMLFCLYGARAFNRRMGGLRALAISLCIGALGEPLIAFDISFLLSAAASLGLIVINPRFEPMLARLRTRLLRVPCEGFLTTVSAMIPCAPLLLVMSPELTLAGMLANVVAGPLGEVLALPLCLLHSVSAPLPSLERGLGLAGSGALVLLEHLAHLSASSTALAMGFPPPSAAHFAVLILGGLWLARVEGGRPGRRALVLCLSGLGLVAAELFTRHRAQPSQPLEVTVLDVGQGDAILVDLPDRRRMLIDGGGALTGSGPDPGRLIVLPVLRARRITHLDVLVLTHPHPDHVNGLVAIAEQLSIGEFWDGGGPAGPPFGAGSPTEQIRAILKRRGTVIRTPSELCQAPHWFGRARIDVLHPCGWSGGHAGGNDSSIVLRIGLGGRAVLLTGDAEHEAEAFLLEHRASMLRADFLKLGHHGSRTSTHPPFLDQVAPKAVGISAGFRNRFGHPHSELLARVRSAGPTVLRTDRDGALRFATDGHQVTLHAARGTPVP